MEAKAAVESYAFDDVRPAPLELPRQGAFVADGDGRGEIASAEHPAEYASFGFAGPAVELRLDGEFAPGTLSPSASRRTPQCGALSRRSSRGATCSGS